MPIHLHVLHAARNSIFKWIFLLLIIVICYLNDKTKSDEIDVNFEWEKKLRFELKQNYIIVTLCKV